MPLRPKTRGIIMLTEKNIWWATYEALCAVAELGKDSFPAQRQLKTSPRVAEAMARHL